MKSRVLFVDDEENVLRGLNRMLRKMRDKWDMAFAHDGEEALALLKTGSADVVVTDMRMPKMDGAQLLDQVRKLHPGSVRIILSGYASEESVMRTVGPAHQYLAKPCDADTVINTVERALALRKLLRSDELRSLVSGIDTLPTPPQIYIKLLKEFESANASAASLAEIISNDIGMAAQTLKLTNSAYFGLATEVTSTLQAVQLLGFDTVKALVLVAGVYGKFLGGRDSVIAMERLSQRSVGVGALAQAICEAESLDKRIADQACCAGMMSHVGTLLLIATWPTRFQRAMDRIDREGIGLVEAERREFGASHAEIGAYLLGVWGFNDPIVEAVAYHHEPGRCACHEVNALAALHAAQFLIRQEDGSEHDDTEKPQELDYEYLAGIGMTDHIPKWRKIASGIEQRGTK